MSINYKKGMSLAEVLVSVFILSLLAALTIGAFSGGNKEQALDTAKVNAVSILERARSLTLFSKGADVYGVHLSSAQAILFEGGVWSSSTPSVESVVFPGPVRLTSIALASGGTDVVFKRLTGETDQSGAITLSLSSDLSQTRTINISATGIAQ